MADSQKTIYEIRVQGHLDKQRSEWFGGLSITHQPDGETILTGEIVDQSALNAILNRLHAMNIKLISVERVDPEVAEGDT
jgi:cell division FtsZ-interacting protein ZapD